MNDFIPVNKPLLNGNERKYLFECIDTGWISSEGPFVKEFEEKFAKSVGRKHGIAVSSGTAALDIAIDVLNIGQGDEVIMPTFTIISSINQIIRCGAKPIFIDSNPLTWNMDVNQIESKISSKTKAIMVVHIYGLPVDMGIVNDLAKRYDLKIIEDAAEMYGQTYYAQPCGSFGDISTFSFYPNKHITTGEGGMIVTDKDELAENCRSSRNLCFKQNQRFVHERLGWNYRMTNMQAAIGLAQLERTEEFVFRKRKMGLLYTELLKDVDKIDLPLERTEYADNIYWVYGIVLKENVKSTAIEVIKLLAKNGIGSRPFFCPMHKQPLLKNLVSFENNSFPFSEMLYEKGFYIPSGMALTEKEIIRTADVVREIIKKLSC